MSGEIAATVGNANAPVRTKEFVRVGNYYVNSALSVVDLGRYLWQQMDQFLGSEGKSRLHRNWEGVLPRTTVRAARVARQLASYLRARAGSHSDDRVLRLPVAGDLAIVRRSGAVKVLDVRNRRVFTVVTNDQERSKLRERIELGKVVAHLPFAPDLVDVDLEAGYFSEEFFSGRHPLNFAGCKDDFSRVYLPLLVQFLTAFEPRWEEISSYAESLRQDIVGPEGLLQRMGREERRTVTRFVERVCAELTAETGKVPLVLSHGDYFSGNIVIDENGYRAIDWANMGFRTPLHDLYYLYLNHCCRVLDWPSVSRRTTRASENLKQSLGEIDRGRLQELDEYLTPSDVLRKLFYLECIQVPLVRCTDPNDRYLASMLVRIGWFEEYEQAMQEERSRERARPLAADVRAAVRLDRGA
ncbi:MAG TPA: phosphotransferase [Trueperaceae bacterium]